MINWLRKMIWFWLGFVRLESNLLLKITSCENRLHAIENLVQVGVDLNFKSPSWIVVCIKGKNQDIVRFFELPDSEISRVYEELKYLEKQFHIRPVFDAPAYIKKEHLKL
jgi:hypothetical protein